ncbi:MAG TPA: hypothetical protein VFG04_25635 [Planctomycetaceae bacterium]|jgi:hypothetical protein|nr:hypothetical protein [Planctomycetaceae bacterium]
MRPEPRAGIVRRCFRAMDLPQYLQGLSFRFIQPEQKRTLAARAASVLTALRVPLDGFNTRLPLDRSDMRRKLRGTRVGSAGLPLAVRAILNRGVAHLEAHEAFVAFSLGGGDSLLAAIARNHEQVCIGIHDTDSHRDPFRRRFAKLSNGEAHFLEPSFKSCVSRLDDRSIGLCFVSANSHEPIARRLVECEPHLAENAYLLLDNGNCHRTRQTAFDFVAASRNQYRVLVDARGTERDALTWGRGLLVVQLLGRNRVSRPLSGRGTSPVLVPAA